MRQILLFSQLLLISLLFFACGSGGSDSVSEVSVPTSAGSTLASTSSGSDSTTDSDTSSNPIVIDEVGASSPEPSPSTPPTAPFEARTIDGTGNNADNLGAAGTAQRLAVPQAYADGVSSPSGAARPSARLVSNALAAQTASAPDPQSRSALVWGWGQFLDHDLDLTLTNDEEPFPIAVPTGDAYFDPTSSGTATIPLSRSVAVEGTGTGTDNPRRHPNAITSFIDGSQVYGSDDILAASLREFSGGRLRVSHGNLPPLNPASTGVAFLCGDIRADENLLLTSLQTLLLREHNRLAQLLATQNPNLDDERLYQLSRKIVGAVIQNITYREFLPALLGPDPLPRYQGYDSTVDPSVSLLFSTAAYRLGHSQVTATLYRRGPDGQPIPQGDLAVRDAFFQPQLLIDEGGIEPLLRGATLHVQETTDVQVIDDLRNFLFGPPGAGGFDLLSLNIQRGRDHGLPDYNSIRGEYGMPILQTFEEITTNQQRQAALSSTYRSIDDVDPWIGLMSEDPAPFSAVGPTLRNILVDQFRRLRDGDRFWYANDPALASYRQTIEDTTLAKLIERNTNITGLTPHAFFVASPRPNPSPTVRARLVPNPKAKPPSL